MNVFWWIFILWVLVMFIKDIEEVSKKGYWQVTKERNQRMFGGAFKVGRFFLRSYSRHHR